jgi:hypothetical protein
MKIILIILLAIGLIAFFYPKRYLTTSGAVSQLRASEEFGIVGDSPRNYICLGYRFERSPDGGPLRDGGGVAHYCAGIQFKKF